MFVYFVLLFMYKYHNEMLPNVIHGFFTRNSSIHGYSTRQENELHVPVVNSDFAKRRIRVTGVKLYNHFHSILDWNSTFVTFKFNAKKFILQNGIASIQ